MRKLSSVVLLLLSAGNSRAAAPATAAFASFFGDFRDAIARNDAKAVAGLTRLPFLFEGKPRDHASFQSVYAELFDEKVRACFKSPKVSGEGDRYVISCGRYIFYFGVVGDRYRLVEFAADPEAAP